jgi:hypothetical protein
LGHLMRDRAGHLVQRIRAAAARLTPRAAQLRGGDQKPLSIVPLSIVPLSIVPSSIGLSRRGLGGRRLAGLLPGARLAPRRRRGKR